MAIQQQTEKFYGGIAKRVWVLVQETSAITLKFSELEFIQKRFNSIRNYREFCGDYPVEVLQITSGKLPRITSFKEGDVCLIIGCGRFLDKASYEFAGKCFLHSIPVFFIRENSLDYDSRVNDSTLWKYNVITTKLGSTKKHYQPPAQYFMQIPKKEHLILTRHSEQFYALLPAMVPVR